MHLDDRSLVRQVFTSDDDHASDNDQVVQDIMYCIQYSVCTHIEFCFLLPKYGDDIMRLSFASRRFHYMMVKKILFQCCS